MGIVDLNIFVGVVCLLIEVEKVYICLLIGMCLQLIMGEVFLVYFIDCDVYGWLLCFLFKGKMYDFDGVWQVKGVCDIIFVDLVIYCDNIVLIVLLFEDLICFVVDLLCLCKWLLQLMYLVVVYFYCGNDCVWINQFDVLVIVQGLCFIVMNDVLYYVFDCCLLQDVMICICEKVILVDVGLILQFNVERYLKLFEVMCCLFVEWFYVICVICELVDRIIFGLCELVYEYLCEVVLSGQFL